MEYFKNVVAHNCVAVHEDPKVREGMASHHNSGQRFGAVQRLPSWESQPVPLGDGASLCELAKLSPVGPAKLHCRML